MYKEIDLDDKSLFETNGLVTEPQGNMTLEEAYDFVMDKVRSIYEMKIPTIARWSGMYMANANKWYYAYTIENTMIVIHDACHTQNMHD